MRASSSWGTSCRSNMLVRVNGVVRALEAVDVPEATFEKRADEVGKAVVQVSNNLPCAMGPRLVQGHLQSKESKSLKRLLQAALVDESRRARRAATVVVVLRREDEGCEPEVGKDPGERGEVALVGFHEGQDKGGKVEESVDSGLSKRISMLELVR